MPSDWCGACGTILDSRFGLAVLATVIAGFVRGFSGFGAALMFIPLAGALYDSRTAILILWTIDAIGTLPFLPPHLRAARWPEVVPLAAGGIVTLPAGVWILTHGDPTWLRWAVSLVVLASTAALASGWRYYRPASRAMTLAVGGVAGFSNGAVGIGGPPVVLFWLSGQANAAQARSNIFAFFAITTVTSLVAYLWQGIFTLPIFVLGVVLTPFYAGALYAGGRVFQRTGDRGFRRAAFWLCGIAAVLGMPIWR